MTAAIPKTMRKLTKYKRNPIFSEVDRKSLQQFGNHCRNLRFVDAARTLYWWIHNEAWKFSPYQVYERHVSANFDRRHGTDTLQRVDISDLRVDGPNAAHGVYYQASPVVSTRKVLASLKIDYEDFVFVDFGSGKGRTLLVASEFPFKKIIGVEFGAELHECAQRNVSTYGHGKAREVEPICMDATKFVFPNANLVLYFFNPFNEYVLGQVLDNLRGSLSEHPRQAFIVYRYLPCQSLISETDGFRLLSDWRRYASINGAELKVPEPVQLR